MDRDPYRWHARGLALMLVVTLPATIVVMNVMRLSSPPVSPWADVAAELGVEPVHLAVGQTFFVNTCAVCHGKDGTGMPRLGKPLRNSEFVQSHTDEELFELIARGRTLEDPNNTTGAIMPPRANNPLLDNDRLAYVVSYLRTLQDLDAPTANLDEWIVEADAAGTMQIGGIGHDIFVTSCSACHGTSGQGMEGLGKPLNSSMFVASNSDEELMKFIKSGRPIWDANNTTGVDMPPKGGNPALSDEEIETIISYIRALHEAQNGG